MSDRRKRGPEGGDRDVFAGSYTGRPEPGRTRWLLIGLAAASFALLALFFGGEYVQRLVRYREARLGAERVPEVSLLEPVRNIALNTLPELPLLADSEQLASAGLPLYDVRIAPKDWQQLQATAREVTARFLSTDVPRDYVPAELLRDGEWSPIEVKLRGLTSSHYLLRRPSLRIKFPRDHLMAGKRQINLLDLYDKGLTIDATTNWELHSRGLLTWESRFAVLRVNGEVLGLYQEIEQFGRALSDRNGRPEGFILSGSGELLGSEGPGYEKAMAAFAKMRAGGDDPPGAACDWDFLRAHFELDRWAWAAAMKELLHSAHGWDPDNLRMFWDPALGQFEPIPWDYAIYPVDLAARPDGESYHRGYGFGFASVPEFRRMRDQRLWQLLSERVEAMIGESERMFEALRVPLSNDLRHVGLSLDEERQAEYGRLLRANAETLRALFSSHEVVARWWPADASGHATLALSNRGKSAIELRAVDVLQTGERQRVELAQPAKVAGRWQGRAGESVIRVALAPNARVVALAIRDDAMGAELGAAEVELVAGVGAAPSAHDSGAAARVPLPDIRGQGIHVAANRVTFGPGLVRLDETLEIDDAYEVVFAAGLDLRLADGVSLILHGDLSSLGEADEPIRVSGDPGWGGVFVHGSRERPSRVHMAHTTFDGGNGGEDARAFFTAPFSVHGGSVTLRSCSFLNSRADDGVNLKYAEVDLRGLYLEGALDDAFDCDFCRGTLVASTIVDVGGDGLDFSGSNLEIAESRVSGCGDKGVSIGEGTRARVVGSHIADCYTGIAVKDRSDAEIVDAHLSRLQVGISLYVKKATFGPSRARVERVELDDVATRLLRDESCALDWMEES